MQLMHKVERWSSSEKATLAVIRAQDVDITLVRVGARGTASNPDFSTTRQPELAHAVGVSVISTPLSSTIHNVRIMSAASRSARDRSAFEWTAISPATALRPTMASLTVPLPGIPTCSRRALTVEIARYRRFCISEPRSRSTSFAALMSSPVNAGTLLMTRNPTSFDGRTLFTCDNRHFRHRHRRERKG